MSDVGEQPPRRAEQQHQAAADRGAEQNRQVAAAGVQADRARQISGADHVVDDQLRGGGADDAGGAVDQQDDHRVPHLERAGEEEHAPRQRRQHEQRLRDLDQLAAVVAVGERAGVQREQQERHPVADDGEAGQRRRVERLEHHPVADDVLDVVGRHRHQAQREVPAVVARVQSGEAGRGDGRSSGRASGHYRDRSTPMSRRNFSTLSFQSGTPLLSPISWWPSGPMAGSRW